MDKKLELNPPIAGVKNVSMNDEWGSKSDRDRDIKYIPGKSNWGVAIVYNIALLYAILKFEGQNFGKMVKKKTIQHVPYKKTMYRTLVYLSIPILIIIPNIFIFFGPSFINKFRMRRSKEDEIINKTEDIGRLMKEFGGIVEDVAKDNMEKH
jgi:hypothetical protein